MATLIAIPILGLLLILQSAIVSRIALIQGTADLVLLALVAWAVQERVRTAWQWSIVGSLLVSVVSAVPLLAILAGYLLTTLIAVLLRQRIWGVRILGMFTDYLCRHVDHPCDDHRRPASSVERQSPGTWR